MPALDAASQALLATVAEHFLRLNHRAAGYNALEQRVVELEAQLQQQAAQLQQQASQVQQQAAQLQQQGQHLAATTGARQAAEARLRQEQQRAKAAERRALLLERQLLQERLGQQQQRQAEPQRAHSLPQQVAAAPAAAPPLPAAHQQPVVPPAAPAPQQQQPGQPSGGGSSDEDETIEQQGQPPSPEEQAEQVPTDYRPNGLGGLGRQPSPQTRGQRRPHEGPNAMGPPPAKQPRLSEGHRPARAAHPASTPAASGGSKAASATSPSDSAVGAMELLQASLPPIRVRPGAPPPARQEARGQKKQLALTQAPQPQPAQSEGGVEQLLALKAGQLAAAAGQQAPAKVLQYGEGARQWLNHQVRSYVKTLLKERDFGPFKHPVPRTEPGRVVCVCPLRGLLPDRSSFCPSFCPIPPKTSPVWCHPFRPAPAGPARCSPPPLLLLVLVRPSSCTPIACQTPA